MTRTERGPVVVAVVVRPPSPRAIVAVAMCLALVVGAVVPVHATTLAHCQVKATRADGTPTKVNCGGTIYVMLTEDEAKKGAAALLDAPRFGALLDAQLSLTREALDKGRECAGKLGQAEGAAAVYAERDAKFQVRDEEQRGTILDLTREVLARHSTVELIVWTVGAGVLALAAGYVVGRVQP